MLRSFLATMVTAGGSPRPVEVSEGSGRVRLCVHVNLRILNYVREQEYHERQKVEGRDNVTGLPLWGACHYKAFYFRTKFMKKCVSIKKQMRWSYTKSFPWHPPSPIYIFVAINCL